MSVAARDKARWSISAGGAILLAGLTLLLFQQSRVAVRLTAPLRVRPPIAVGHTRADELTMRDLAPLFLPTDYNAAPQPMQAPEPGRDYFEREPVAHTLFDVDTPKLRIAPRVPVPAVPAEVVGLPPPPLAAGVGRTNRELAPAPPSGGHVDIYAAEGAQSVLGLALDVAAAPPASAAARWQPLEFTAAVDRGGLADALVLTRSSGVEEVDVHFRNFLARSFHLGDRLPPGFYRIVVAP